jgi:hypothetical protein
MVETILITQYFHSGSGVFFPVREVFFSVRETRTGEVGHQFYSPVVS